MDCLWNSLRLFDALGKAGCRRLVGIGTCFEYDSSYGYLSESTPTKATSLYAAAKTSTFLMGEQLAEIHGMSFAWARLFFLFGPDENANRLIPYVIGSLLRGERAGLTSGNQVRDFLHVEDVASAIISVLEGKCSGPVNVGSGFPVTVREIVWLLGEILDRHDLIDFGARPSNATDPAFLCADNSKLKSDTDWVPRYDLDEGLRATISWWKKHRSDRKEQST
jgi:nucleoside-diphosphate-sugar epimerase